MNEIVLPVDVAEIIGRLNKHGYEAYIVGGCVRDSILGREPQDWDVTTSAKPEELKLLFTHTVDTGIQHGTVTVVLNRMNYEVTTYRVDGEYQDCRRPNCVAFTANLKEDLLRRDFTMNAIAYHPVEGFQDPFDGRSDIKQRIIRGVGEASVRFEEDALRMLRCVRFSAQLGFDIEGKTYEALCNHIDLICCISVERIREEMTKLWISPVVEKIPLLWESGLLGRIDGMLAERLANQRERRTNQLRDCPKDSVFCWTLVLQEYTQKEAEGLLKRMKFDNASMREILLLLKYISIDLPVSPYEIRKLASKTGKAAIETLLVLQQILRPRSMHTETRHIWRNILENGDCLTLKELAMDGQDLMNMGISPGKQMGEWLSWMLDKVHEEPKLNEKELLMHFVQGEMEKAKC